MSSMVGSSDTQNNSNRVGSVLYYSITAAVVIGLAAIVILAKWWYNRKHKREMQARIDLERQAMTRRGEAPDLPTYLDQSGTTRVPMPTLSYPEMAYRGNGQEWEHVAPDGTSHPGAQHDLNLPSYENEPPKYEYNNNLSPSENLALSRSSTRRSLERSTMQHVGSRPSLLSRPSAPRTASADMVTVPLDNIPRADQRP
ncbi:hypothetical protein EMMF5_005532 [Cystobasidiomycetes sp. EMM_F5]